MQSIQGRSYVLTALVLFALVYCAAAVNFSWIQDRHNSDTVLHTLISIDQYSPFYWSENRFGMLVPLLAMPVRHYGWNLLLQTQILVLAGIALVTLLGALDDMRVSPAARVPLVAIPLLVVFKPLAALVLLLPAPYLVSLCLLTSALVVLFRSQRSLRFRFGAAAVILALSFWVNASNVVMASIAILVFPRHQNAPARIRLAALVLTLACASGIVMFSSIYPGEDFKKLLPFSEWMASLLGLNGNLPIFIRPAIAAGVIGAAIAMQFIRRGHALYAPAHALAIGAACQIAVTATSEWVARNSYDARYIIGPVFVILTVALHQIVGIIVPVFQRFAGRSAAIAGSCLLSIVVVTTAFGFPSPAAALARIEDATNDAAGPVERLSCTHLIGDYWFVWATVFHDRLSTGERRLWGITHRSNAVRDAWNSIPAQDRRYCAMCADPQIEHMRLINGVGLLAKEGELSGICAFKEHQ